MPVLSTPAAPEQAVAWRQWARRVMGQTLPRRLLLVQGPRSSSAVALTFDDGPDPVHTPRLLDVLQQLAIPATFFVIGEKAERYPDLVRRIVAEGHALGGHSYSHSRPETTSARQLMAEVGRTCKLIEDMTGESTPLFRPPHGKLTFGKLVGLWAKGQSVVLWNVDPKDFACRSADEVTRRLKAQPPQGGDVVLMHDSVAYAPDVVPKLADDVVGRGLRFTTVVPWVFGERRPQGGVRDEAQFSSQPG